MDDAQVELCIASFQIREELQIHACRQLLICPLNDCREGLSGSASAQAG
jgi:hypothetical protein